jgi:hypothetical protein
MLLRVFFTDNQNARLALNCDGKGLAHGFVSISNFVFGRGCSIGSSSGSEP